MEKLSLGVISEKSKAEFLVASKKLDDLLLKQEIYWAQRSWVNWLKHGDIILKFSTPRLHKGVGKFLLRELEIKKTIGWRKLRMLPVL